MRLVSIDNAPQRSACKPIACCTVRPMRVMGSASFDDFYRSMKRGVRPDSTRLYPTFPYPSFARLTDADIASIDLHMKTVEPIDARSYARASAIRPARSPPLKWRGSASAILGPTVFQLDEAALDHVPADPRRHHRGDPT